MARSIITRSSVRRSGGTGGTGGGTITKITSTGGTVVITNSTGPIVNLEVVAAAVVARPDTEVFYGTGPGYSSGPLFNYKYASDAVGIGTATPVLDSTAGIFQATIMGRAAGDFKAGTLNLARADAGGPFPYIGVIGGWAVGAAVAVQTKLTEILFTGSEAAGANSDLGRIYVSTRIQTGGTIGIDATFTLRQNTLFDEYCNTLVCAAGTGAGTRLSTDIDGFLYLPLISGYKEAAGPGPRKGGGAIAYDSTSTYFYTLGDFTNAGGTNLGKWFKPNEALRVLYAENSAAGNTTVMNYDAVTVLRGALPTGYVFNPPSYYEQGKVHIVKNGTPATINVFAYGDGAPTFGTLDNSPVHQTLSAGASLMAITGLKNFGLNVINYETLFSNDLQRMFGTLPTSQLTPSATNGYVMATVAGAPAWVDPSTIAAAWAGRRHYAVDKSDGLDTHTGYGATKTLAGAAAVQTIAKLLSIIPPAGRAGQALSIWFATPTDLSDYAEDCIINSLTGYDDITIGATGTQATAGAVKFSGSAADQIYAGARVFAGTETLGYRCSGIPTALIFTCVKNSGGAAPALAAEPGLTRYRIRFDSATPTALLRNYVANIWKNTTNEISLDAGLPAVPVAGGAGVGDVFYIEEPGFGAQVFVATNIQCRKTNGFRYWGIRTTSNVAGALQVRQFGNVREAFCFSTGASATQFIFGGSSYKQLNTVVDDTGTQIRVGGSLASAPTVQKIASVVMTNGGGGDPIFESINSLQVGTGSTYAAHLYLTDGIVVAEVGGRTDIATRFQAAGGTTIGTINGCAVRTFLNGITVDADASAATLWIPKGQVAGDTVRYPGGAATIDRITTSGTGFLRGVDLDSCTCLRVSVGKNGGLSFTGANFGIFNLNGNETVISIDTVNRVGLRDTCANEISGTNGAGFLVRSFVDDSLGTNQYFVLRGTATGGHATPAQATSAANCSSLVGVKVGTIALAAVGGYVLVKLDADPGSLPAKAYVSAATAGHATDTPPAAPNYVECIGTIVDYFAGESLAVVQWEPDQAPVLGV